MKRSRKIVNYEQNEEDKVFLSFSSSPVRMFVGVSVQIDNEKRIKSKPIKSI